MQASEQVPFPQLAHKLHSQVIIRTAQNKKVPTTHFEEANSLLKQAGSIREHSRRRIPVQIKICDRPMVVTMGPAKGDRPNIPLERKWRCFVPSRCSNTVPDASR